jgi:DNA-binding MarR family transcriptional regulator
MLPCKKYDTGEQGDAMKDITSRCKKYLFATLGISANLSKIARLGPLPFFLAEGYAFYKIQMFDETFTIMVPKVDEVPTPATIKKHMNMAEQALGVKTIFLDFAITSFNRKRLVDYKVPFIVPENQLYLPGLGIDFREHFIKQKPKPVIFGPATQAVIIHALTRLPAEAVTPKQLAENLGYSKMTMTRAINEIETAGIADISTKGRERRVCFDQDKRKIWEKSLPYLKTPVKEIVWLNFVKADWKICEAGLTALAHLSMMAPPKQPVYAIRDMQWKEIKQKHPEISVYPDEAKGQLEIWRYDPLLFSTDGRVDPFSLFLSLKDVDDERIDAALDGMMENLKW